MYTRRLLIHYTALTTTPIRTMSTFTAKYADAHNHPKGAGDARPTGQDVIDYYKLHGKMTDKVALVTGCTPGGLGVDTAKALQLTGAQLYLTVRDSTKYASVVDDVHSVYKEGKRPVLLDMDLGSLASVRKTAETFLQHSQQLNILICNAGVMACPEGKTVDGFETQLGVNHFGHFLLIQLLLSTLIKSSLPAFNSRVIMVSSSGHSMPNLPLSDMTAPLQPYNEWVAYGRSKTANIWTSNEIDRRYGGKGVHSWSLMPGGIISGLQKHMSEEQKKGLTSPYAVKIMKSTAQGSSTTVWGAVSPELEGQGGKYLDDCVIAGPKRGDEEWDMIHGVSEHAYDQKHAAKLYDESLQMVGLSKDELKAVQSL